MGVTINGPSSWFPSQAAASQQRKQDYSAILSGAQSGDIDKAQTAYASLTANRAPPSDSPLAALGMALQSGDVTAVQKEAAALPQAHTGHGGHLHHADAAMPTQLRIRWPSRSRPPQRPRPT